MALKIKNWLVGAFIVFSLLINISTPALAAVDTSNGGGSTSSTSSGGVNYDTANADPCHPENHVPPSPALSPTDLRACENCKSSSVTDVQHCLSTNPIVRDLNTIVNFLAGAVGVVVVAMLVLGGIQYATARNKPEAVTSAKSRITNALIALIAFMLIYAFLQWLIPGGAFS